ncbi:hypothetical protein [Treponema sp. R6D11]
MKKENAYKWVFGAAGTLFLGSAASLIVGLAVPGSVPVAYTVSASLASVGGGTAVAGAFVAERTGGPSGFIPKIIKIAGSIIAGVSAFFALAFGIGVKLQKNMETMDEPFAIVQEQKKEDGPTKQSIKKQINANVVKSEMKDINPLVR